MPKERINTPDTYPLAVGLPVIRDGMTEIAGAPDSAITGTRTDPTVYVGWQNGDAGHVQISLDMDAAQVIEVLGSEHSDADRIAIYTGILRRTEINRMIKVLRRARDAAYGRDE